MNAHSIPDSADLVSLIERRFALVDGLTAVWPRRRAERPKGQQAYRDRAEREHRARVAAFEGTVR